MSMFEKIMSWNWEGNTIGLVDYFKTISMYHLTSILIHTGLLPESSYTTIQRCVD